MMENGELYRLHDEPNQRLSSPPPPPTVRIFCDFDGTVIDEDVGDAFFSAFVGPTWEEDNRAYREGRRGARETFERYTSRMMGLTAERIHAWLRTYRVHSSFPPFVHAMQMRKFPVEIVSDGLDAYILPLLAEVGVSVPVIANHLLIREDGTCRVLSPYADETCTVCGTCKRNHIMVSSGEHDTIVLVGDGISDFCAAEIADVVFARSELEKFCRQRNITFRRYFTFDDILSEMEKLCRRRSFPHPRRAALSRASVWRSG
ncbi:MAG: MtnX-like HAD-IB family phosphatase [Bacteroidota bacterium]|nr:MtnX-like HAD-IB family phosphatase [Bacteroidota bacterium]